MKTVYNKLARDRIPEIIQADGKNAVTRYSNDSFPADIRSARY